MMNKREKQQAQTLLKKYQQGRCTLAEEALIYQWYAQWNEPADEGVAEKEVLHAEMQLWKTLLKRLKQKINQNKKFLWVNLFFELLIRLTWNMQKLA